MRQVKCRKAGCAGTCASATDGLALLREWTVWGLSTLRASTSGAVGLTWECFGNTEVLPKKICLDHPTDYKKRC